jgi:hypothetical protein
MAQETSVVSWAFIHIICRPAVVVLLCDLCHSSFCRSSLMIIMISRIKEK